MGELRWTPAEARRFQLWSVGLLGRRYPRGKRGVLACFDDLDTLQLDALPLMGRSHDLVMQARVDGVRPDMTLDAIHAARAGFEYWDKAYCALPLRHLPLVRPYMAGGGSNWFANREAHLQRHAPGALERVYEAVRQRGPLSSSELGDLGSTPKRGTGWKPPKVTSIALETLWHRGQIATTHRVNYRKYFDLSERVFPEAALALPPLPWKHALAAWLEKRVRNVGLLPLRGDAEAWAIVREAKASGVLDDLLRRGRLTRVAVEGVKLPFLAPGDAEEGLKQAASHPFSRRVRFIAPLDQLIWCRQAAAHLWDFDYVWEVYKPPKQRRWGYYVLPVLYRDRFVARFDGKFDRNTGMLQVLAYHQEPGGLPLEHAAVEAAFARFTKYLGAQHVEVVKSHRRSPKR